MFTIKNSFDNTHTTYTVDLVNDGMKFDVHEVKDF